MKIPWSQFTSLFVALALPLALKAADSKPEQLNKGASKAIATLEVKEVSAVIADGEKAGMKYSRTSFRINTGTKDYLMNYKSLPADEAKENPRILNDRSSGYGMVKPDRNWYANGFVTASIKGARDSDIQRHQGKVRVLKTEGERVGYDLVFEMEQGTIVVRTVALGGRDELFVAVRGMPAETGMKENLMVGFRGYPMGFDGIPREAFDRWVHTASADIGHGGTAQKATPLDIGKDQWALLTDHHLADGRPGQLGLIWAPGKIEEAQVVHNGNYGIDLNYAGSDINPEHRFMVCHLDGMTWQEARKHMAELAKDATSAIQQALDGWDAAR